MDRLAPLFSLLGLLGLFQPSFASDHLALLPPSLTLEGPRASHRLLVIATSDSRSVSDLTPQASFRSDNPSIAQVTPDGQVTPISDGTTTITATIGDRTAEATVTVVGSARPTPINFRNEVQPVLTRLGCNMGACHGSAAGKNGFRLTLRGYGPELDHQALTRQALGRRVRPTAPAQSLLLLKPTGALPHGGGVRLDPTSPEYAILIGWIAEGCPPPSDDDPRIIRVEAVPSQLQLTPGQTHQLLVRAHYDDGRALDVTRWAKFESTDASVAKVDESGQIRVTGPGAAAISVWFDSHVDLANLVVPSSQPPDPALFASAPRHNPIDTLNLQRLQALGIPPSPLCDDATFLRRAYLGATGTLPPASELDSFLADPDPSKRSRLIDHLLASPEFVDFWSYKWSDLLLVSSKKLTSPAVWSFYRFVRQAVAENRPWDQFARQILTAKGSTLSNGAANYFVLHRDPIDLTESTSVAFLGLSLTCARCHNHPLEKWTQDQYYGMANLFARVSLKDGAGADGSVAAGDVIVTPAPEGDILHPRRNRAMPPQPLDGEPLPLDDRGDRRVAFADWLADPSNPYFDRALVNRVWAQLLGRGLIDPEDDLRATNPPSDPALLDWLVADFRAHGRDVRHLIRTIMNSAVYQRSSDPEPGNAHDQKFLSHYVPRRLSAEILLDASDRVTGVPSSYAGYPPGFRSLQLPDSRVENAFLDAFGRPLREAVCSCERSDEPSVAQALHLVNGATINDKLRSDQGTVARLVREGATDEQILETLFATALTRRPTDAERAALLPTLADATAGLEPDSPDAQTARRQAVEDLFWAVLTTKEFLFDH
ncbi:MAG: S-layer protein [Isosphaeraceae bacterium]|jgi:hypothetical protein|nr:MAG: S-layer protein [Isosphaeraceae bacterium]